MSFVGNACEKKLTVTTFNQLTTKGLASIIFNGAGKLSLQL